VPWHRFDGRGLPRPPGSKLPARKRRQAAALHKICASAYLIAFAINHLLAPKFEPSPEVA